MSEERKMIYLCLAHMSEDGAEQKYVKEAFDTNWVVPMGPNVNAFEQDPDNAEVMELRSAMQDAEISGDAHSYAFRLCNIFM